MIRFLEIAISFVSTLLIGLLVLIVYQIKKIDNHPIIEKENIAKEDTVEISGGFFDLENQNLIDYKCKGDTIQINYSCEEDTVVFLIKENYLLLSEDTVFREPLTKIYVDTSIDTIIIKREDTVILFEEKVYSKYQKVKNE